MEKKEEDNHQSSSEDYYDEEYDKIEELEDKKQTQ